MFSLRDLVWLGDTRVNTLYKGDKDDDDDDDDNNNNSIIQWLFIKVPA